MAYFVVIENGRVAELFDDSVLSPPAGAVAISDEDGNMLRAVSKFGDYRLDGGRVVHDPVIVSSVPASVTMRQARLALLQNGLLAQVNAAVAAMPGDEGEAARIEWEFSSTVERNRPMTQALISALGLTEAKADDLFRLADSL